MRAPRVVCAVGLAFVPAVAAAAPKPSATSVTLNAASSTIVYSTPTTLSGRLSGPSSAAVAVRLQQDSTRPYGDAYTNSSLATTSAANGKYSFSVKPLVNTQYRVVAQTSPPITSSPRLVLVRMLVGVHASDLTPRRGSRVLFSGSVFPAHDGRLVAIQRRSSSGRFNTVGRTTLRDAGDAKSTYGLRVRVNRDGVYRVKVVGDDDHVNGLSRLKTLNVHD
jgi:hypothetical protein